MVHEKENVTVLALALRFIVGAELNVYRWECNEGTPTMRFVIPLMWNVCAMQVM